MAQKGTQRCAEFIENMKHVWPDFDIHTDDLNKPTLTSVCKFFDKLLDELGIDVEKITMKLTEHMSCPDAYQDIIHYYVLYRCAKGFLERLKLKTLTQPFTVSDILRPNPKSTKIRVMLISNFLLYAHKLLEETLNPIQNRVKEELVQIDAMHKDLDDLGIETNTIAVELSDIEKSLDQLQKEKEECYQKYEEQLQTNEGILQDNEKGKQECNELETERTLLLEILRNETAKEDELNQLVVDDYETIAAERERLEKEIAEAESHTSNCAVNLDMKNESELQFHTFSAILDEFFEQEPLEDILEMYEVQDTKKAFIEKMNEELQGLHMFQKDFHSISRKMQEEADVLEEEIQATRVQIDAKEPALLEEIKCLDAERNKLTLKITRDDHQTKAIQQKIQHAIECCAKHERNLHELNQFHQKKYKEILQNTGTSHNKVDHHLKEVKSKAEQIKNPFHTQKNEKTI